MRPRHLSGASGRPLNFAVSRHQGSSVVVQASFRGGARIGWVNASWPFAKLTADASALTLSSLGTYTFTPSQVVALEPYGSLPIISSGIRIRHNRRDYPKTIIFWCMGRRGAVLEEVAGTGFSATGQPIDRAPGFPVRWSAIFVVIALWNGLFLLDRAHAGSQSRPGAFALVALLLLLAAATAAQKSPQFQRLVLREGHEVGEIKSFLVLIQIVTGIMAVAFGFILLAHGDAG